MALGFLSFQFVSGLSHSLYFFWDLSLFPRSATVSSIINVVSHDLAQHGYHCPTLGTGCGLEYLGFHWCKWMWFYQGLQGWVWMADLLPNFLRICFHSPLSLHQEALSFVFTFCHKGGVLCLSWGYWYFSQKAWFQLVLHPDQGFSWCTLHISKISRVTIYRLDVFLSLFGTSLVFHVQF